MKRTLKNILLVGFLAVGLGLKPIKAQVKSEITPNQKKVTHYLMRPLCSGGIQKAIAKPLIEDKRQVWGLMRCCRCLPVLYIGGMRAFYEPTPPGKAIETPWILSGVPASVENRNEYNLLTTY